MIGLVRLPCSLLTSIILAQPGVRQVPQSMVQQGYRAENDKLSLILASSISLAVSRNKPHRSRGGVVITCLKAAAVIVVSHPYR